MDIYRKISPHPSLPKRGIIPPFGLFNLPQAGKGRLGGILSINVVIIMRLLVITVRQRRSFYAKTPRHKESNDHWFRAYCYRPSL
jgi:hypothetical protein